MSIESRFDKIIYVQTGTVVFGGATTYASAAATNKGYIRILSQRERASIDKPTLFCTHRVAMTCNIVPVYGQFLLIDSIRYKVKGVNPQKLSGGTFQTVDCELVI